MAHQQYKNPPLFEIVCEIRFSSNKWDVFFFSDFYEKIKERFPDKTTTQEVFLPGQPFALSEGVTIEGSFLQKRHKLMCKNKANNVSIRFSENLLAINLIPPYNGWDNFKEIILFVLESYKEIVCPNTIEKILLKYRNKINTGEEHSYENICNTFSYRPQLETTNAIFQSLAAVQMIVEIKANEEKDILILEQNTLTPDEEQKAPVLFDLNYLSLDASGLIDSTAYTRWLDLANDAIHEAFEAALTPNAKANFN